MYLPTLSKHPHVNSNQFMIIVYKIYYLIQSRSMICVSLSGLIMSSLIDLVTRDTLDTNVIAHDKNLIIMISSRFLLCYVKYYGLH